MRQLLLALALIATPAYADDVTLLLDGRTLVGQFDGREAMRNGVVVIVHDYLSHFDEPTVALLRNGLSGAGRAVLAVNLSLGIDGRRGPFPCDRLHEHRFSDALPEIDQWLGWLAEQGAGPVTLVGVVGGAAQVAYWSTLRPQGIVAELALVYPATFVPTAERGEWERATGRSLDTLLRIGATVETTPIPLPRFLACPPSRVTAASFLSYYGGDGADRDTPTLLPKIDLPTMVIVSEEASRTRKNAGAGVEIERVDDPDQLPLVVEVFIETERLPVATAGE